MDLFSADQLQAFAARVFEARGFSPEHAQTVATALVWAERRGIDSHGLVRLAQYLRHVDDGDMKASPNLRVVEVAPAVALVEADFAAGPIAMSAALEAALERARQCGIGLALARETTHTAALGWYTSRAAQRGFAAIAFSDAPPQMAYHGARGAAVSTGPFSIAVPADPEPVLFDMASSVVGLGKLLQTGKRGGVIQPGWATDEEGNPSTDPARATIPLPIAGAKGSGLSLMIELLTGVMSGNPVIADALLDKDGRHRQNGLVIAIDVARFGSLEGFRREVERLAGAIHGLPPSDADAPVRLPGERGSALAARRQVEGVPLPPPLVKTLKDIAAKRGVAFPDPR